MIIIPAILASSVEEFQRQHEKLSSLSQRLHVDVSDGLFGPPTITFEQIIPLLSHERRYDIHFMVHNPQHYLEDLPSNARALIHAPHTTAAYGIVFSPDDQLENFSSYAAVQIMSVVPGRQGNPFLPTTLERLSVLRESGYKGELILDGGISEDTAHYIQNAVVKPDTVCVGSYLTGASTPGENYKRLSSFLQA